MSQIDAIKERLDIVDVIGGYVKLQKAGRNFKANCPFHEERTPSFIVFPESQRWRCFGACNEGGDIFTFVMKREGWDFGEALQRLAERAGVELEQRSPQAAEEDQAHERLRTVLSAAARFYNHLLLNTPAGARARAYVEKRHLGADTVERFQIGFAPEGWDAARNYLSAQGYSVDELVQSGILTRNADSGSIYDRFRDRLIIPIRDGQGRVIGFGGRSLGGQDPKYLNSPQSPVFDKGSVLFGLDLARKSIRESGTAVIVEGYMDVIGAHQGGFTNVVAQMGTALTEAQLRSIKRFARRLVIALDPDAAGASATLRDLAVARETLDRTGEAVFDPSGLLRFEGRLQADIRVLSLPEGQDPDEVIYADPDDWRRRVENAQPVVEYVLGIATAGRDLDDPKVKADIARQMLPLIGDVANPIERDGYLQKMARLLRVDERAMREQAEQLKAPGAARKGQAGAGYRRGPERGDAGAGASASASAEGPARAAAARPVSPVKTTAPDPRVPDHGVPDEGYCLAVLLREPHLLAAADQMLVSAGLEVLVEGDFEGLEYREMFRRVRAHEVGEPLQWEDVLDETLHPRLKQLEVLPLPEDEEKMRAALLDVVFRLRERRLNERGRELQFLVQESADGKGLYYQAQSEHTQMMNRLRRLQLKRSRYAMKRDTAP